MGAEAGEVVLTPRETDVLRLVALGWRNEHIAEELGVTLNTVRSHVVNLRWKLEAESPFLGPCWLRSGSAFWSCADTLIRPLHPILDKRNARAGQLTVVGMAWDGNQPYTFRWVMIGTAAPPWFQPVVPATRRSPDTPGL